MDPGDCAPARGNGQTPPPAAAVTDVGGQRESGGRRRSPVLRTIEWRVRGGRFDAFIVSHYATFYANWCAGAVGHELIPWNESTWFPFAALRRIVRRCLSVVAWAGHLLGSVLREPGEGRSVAGASGESAAARSQRIAQSVPLRHP